MGMVLLCLMLFCTVLFGCSYQNPSSLPVGTLFDDEQEFVYMDSPKGFDLIGDADWTTLDFDANNWFKGIGPFGAKDGEKVEIAEGYTPNVVLNQYDSDGDNLPVFYFRTEFGATQDDQDDTYAFGIAYDDAVVIYLNGKNIYEGNVPDGGFNNKGFGASKIWEAPHKDTVIIKGQDLRVGQNVLAIELHQATKDSSDIYLEVGALNSVKDTVASRRDESVFLGAGANEEEVLITWHGAGDLGKVEVVAGSDDATFSQSPMIYDAYTAYENDDGSSTFRATLDGLMPGATYQYRVIDDTSEHPSAIQSFTVPESGSFSFIVNGDPQLADSTNPEPMENYTKLFNAAAEGITPSFVLSLGDQSDDADDPALFSQFVNADVFNQIPLVAVVGNHEYKDDTFSHYFYLPNMSDNGTEKTGDMGGDYWFARNGALFLVLNTNNSDIDSHATFMQDAKSSFIAEYGEPTWIIVAFHHSLYSTSGHVDSDDTIALREGLVPVLQNIGADVVFSGHDHSYTRTFPLYDGQISGSGEGTINGSQSVVYFTIGSSTGTKFYDTQEGAFYYAAVVLQDEKPCMTRVDVSDSALTTSTYLLESDGAVKLADRLTIMRR